MTKHTKRKFLYIISTLLAILALISIFYVRDYYHASTSVNQYLKSTSTVKAEAIDDGIFLDGPGTENALIFYPGAKVEYTAYVPLLHRLAEQGIDIFLVKMPGNLAIFGQNKASDIMEQYDYDEWYIGGHSLGGVMAASYAAKHGDVLDGLVLLAAYPTKELPQKDFKVVSIYGSEDGVLHMDKVEKGRGYVPKDYTEVCIDGGNHAQFGDYGVQKGDGEAEISREEQQEQTADVIVKALNK